MEKGQRGQSCSSGQESDPASSRGGPRSKTPPKPHKKHSKCSFPGRGKPGPSIFQPHNIEGDGNNGFSFLSCTAKMERQVESGLGLRVRRALLVPALQMTSLQQTGWNSSPGMPRAGIRIFRRVFCSGWMGGSSSRPHSPSTRHSRNPQQINSRYATNPWLGRELPKSPKPRFQQELAPAPLQ